MPARMQAALEKRKADHDEAMHDHAHADGAACCDKGCEHGHDEDHGEGQHDHGHGEHEHAEIN